MLFGQCKEAAFPVENGSQITGGNCRNFTAFMHHLRCPYRAQPICCNITAMTPPKIRANSKIPHNFQVFIGTVEYNTCECHDVLIYMQHDLSVYQSIFILQKFERMYNEQAHRGEVSEKAQFDYAWCLIRSKYLQDMKKGVALMEGQFEV